MHTNGQLAIALLQRHLQFIIDRFEKYHGNDSELKPAELGDIFSERWTREAITRIVDRGRNHLTQACFSPPLIIIEGFSLQCRAVCYGTYTVIGSWSGLRRKLVLRGM